MEERIEISLDEIIGECLVKLRDLDPGTEEYEHVSKDLDRLYKLKLEEDKLLYDFETNKNRIDADRTTNKEKIEHERIKQMDEMSKHSDEYEISIMTNKLEEEKLKAEKIRTGATVGATIISAATTVYLALKTMKFEETGTIRSKAWPKIFNITKNV